MRLVSDVEQQRPDRRAPDAERRDGQRQTVLDQELERRGGAVGEFTGDQHELGVRRELADALVVGEPLPVVPEDVLAAPVERRQLFQAGRAGPPEVFEAFGQLVAVDPLARVDDDQPPFAVDGDQRGVAATADRRTLLDPE
ncbi:hypothetical protein [Cryptosporangium aurantiacum]|uniref:hypothetical protein n=1 Tax=Cryptosporangium aurantiacum TaxID=134849 RepID=UPI001160F6B9|nr:hypothetical protein [Cryptosporangium aurantiacum]